MSETTGCIFCRIVAGEIPCYRIYEDDATLAFMDINPANEGHALVIPKVHAADVHAVPDEAIAAVAIAARKVAGAVSRVLSPDGLNLVQCNGSAAGQSVMHFHMHVLPRADGDGLAMNWGITPGDMAAIGALAERLRAAL